MEFSIVSDTAGAKVGDLTSELRRHLEPLINEHYENVKFDLGIAIRCLPENYNRKSFIRYSNKDSYLTVDICVDLEKYEKYYKIEQRYYLGKILLEYLNKGLDNKNIPADFNKKKFIDDIIKWGKQIGWFENEIDWSKDLDS